MAKRRSGFTFVELMVAALIFSFVSLSIAVSFNVGIRAWKQGKESYRSRQEARYSMGLISRELRNAINSKVIPFTGDAGSVSFCKSVDGVFRVTYSFDDGVCRTLQTYKEDASSQPGTVSRLASTVSGLRFLYADVKDGNIEWVEAWEKDRNTVPFGVKVFLMYEAEGSTQPTEISQTILMPTWKPNKQEGT